MCHYALCGAMSERREKKVRFNASDMESVEAARESVEEFDDSTATAFICRYACQQLAEAESESDSGGVHL